jgi:small multidrug resistance family-3 protein
LSAIGLYAFAAVAEILGCFAVWSWWRGHASGWWLVPGTVALFVFAFALALTAPEAAGRSFATYAGIYLLASVCWLKFVEKQPLLPTDILGAALVFFGAMVILWGGLGKT